MSVGLLLVLVVIAVVAGLAVGGAAGKSLTGSEDRGPKTLSARARSAATRAAFKVWTWRRSSEDD